MASYKSVGFADERRTLADTHKPRGRNDRIERDKILGWRAPLDVREAGNNRDSRDERGSRDVTKEMSQKRSALKLNTDIPMAPRAQISPPKDSPTSGRPSAGTVNLFNYKNRVPSTNTGLSGLAWWANELTVRASSGAFASRTATPTRPCPKSSDPTLQGTFGAFYRSYELISKRTLLQWQREKKKKEMEVRRTEASTTPSEFASLRDAQKLQRTRDDDELRVLTEKFSTVDKDHRGNLEAIAAIVQRAQPPASGLPAAPPTTDPAVADLAARFADLEQKHRQAQDEIQKLQTARPRWTELEEKLSQAQEAIVELQTSRVKSNEEHEKTTEVCRALMSKQNELEKDKSALADENAQLKEKVTALQEDFVEMRNAMSSKASKVDLMEAKVSAQSSATDLNSAQQNTDALSLMMEELKTRVTTAETSLERVDCKATRVGSDFASVRDRVFKASTEISSIRSSVSKVEGFVAAMEGTMARVDTELAAVHGTVSGVDTKLAAVQGRISTVESELSTVLEHTDNLDFKTLDDMGDQWLTHNIGESVPIMKQKLENLETDIAQMRQIPNQQQKLLNELQDIHLSRSMKEQGLRRVQEPTPPVPDDDLKKQVIELQQKSQLVAQLQIAVASTGHKIEMIQEKLQENFPKLRKYIDDSILDQAGLFGEMLSGVSDRVTELEGARRGFVDMMDDLTPRVTKLEVTTNEPNASCEDVKTKLTAVEQKLAALPDMEVGASAQRDVQLLTQKVQNMEVHLANGGKRLDAVTLGIEALSDQLSHITTRHLFDLIVKHVDQNHNRYGSRISSLETRLASTQNDINRANETLQRLHEVHATRRVDTKRSASPAIQTAENNAKRMRMASIASNAQ